jgi:hypothetical protein
MARSDIYGIDDNAFAQRIANESLDTSKGDENAWGGGPVEAIKPSSNRPYNPGKVRIKSVKTDGDKPGDSENN